MKAIGYARVSSDDQVRKGKGLPDQKKAIEDYCRREGLYLADILEDDGYSASKGEHLAKGNLGKLLPKVDAGKYKCFALVVDEIDRLSRLDLDETQQLIRRFWKGGLEVHLVMENRVIHNLNDLTTQILNLVRAEGARAYTDKLAERVGRRWNEKKHNGKAGIAITNKLPGWFLPAVNGDAIVPDPAKVKVLRNIFEWTAQGMGKRLIARRLNENGVPPFGGGRKPSTKWIHSYVQKLVTNRAVLGEYQPYKGKGRKRTKDGEVRLGFYPAVIDERLWMKAQRGAESRRTVSANGHATGKFSGRNGALHNLFTGLVWEGDQSMQYEDKGKKGRPKLATQSKDLNGTTPNRLDYQSFERAFLHWLDQLDWQSVLDVTDSNEILSLEQGIDNLDLEVSRTRKRVKTIVELLIDTPSESLKEDLLETEQKLKAQTTQKAELEKALNTAKVRHSNLVSTDVVYYQLAGLKDFESRVRLREEIRRKVGRIDVTFGVEIIVAGASEGNGVRPGTGRTMVRVRFVNGVERVLLFQENDVVLLWLGEAQAIRPAVTREEAERFWDIRPLVNTPTNGTKNFG